MSLIDWFNSETKTLTIPYTFNEELKDIPKDTQIIIFVHYALFNQKVDNLPQSLTYLTFGNRFNQKVDNLPQSLTHITFGWDFNKKVDKLPKNLTHLTFSNRFNQKVDNFPKNLTYLTLYSEKFNKTMNFLPKTLINLKIGWYINCDIIIPKNLKNLFLTCNNNLINNIPNNIEKLYILLYDNKKVENLPFTLKEIIIEDAQFKQNIKIPFGTVLTIKKYR